tara:strand:+ start:1641 stop:2837 length:1197 start_codon:yes stop_codon:yes gene_type:complete
MINNFLRFSKLKISPILLFILIFAQTNVHSYENIEANNSKVTISKGLRKAQADLYLLGPGDQIQIDFSGLPELNTSVTIGPDGLIYLPEVRYFEASGITLIELEEKLTEEYKKFIRNPILFARIINYRPVRVFISGEVERPGFYTLNGVSSSAPSITTRKIESLAKSTKLSDFLNQPSSSMSIRESVAASGSDVLFPTLFDTIRAASGITFFSDLSNITVIRKTSRTNQHKNIKTEIDLWDLFLSGDQSKNIRIFDGDSIHIKKSKNNITERIRSAKNSNLSPELILVYVSGKVAAPGPVTIPNGSSLNQAVAMAGGKNFLSGRVEFLRFNQDEDIDRRSFNYNPNAKIDAYQNPRLMGGDVIDIKDSTIGKASAILQTVATPLITSYSLINLLNLNN